MTRHIGERPIAMNTDARMDAPLSLAQLLLGLLSELALPVSLASFGIEFTPQLLSFGFAGESTCMSVGAAKIL